MCTRVADGLVVARTRLLLVDRTRGAEIYNFGVVMAVDKDIKFLEITVEQVAIS